MWELIMFMSDDENLKNVQPGLDTLYNKLYNKCKRYKKKTFKVKVWKKDQTFKIKRQNVLKAVKGHWYFKGGDGYLKLNTIINCLEELSGNIRTSNCIKLKM